MSVCFISTIAFPMQTVFARESSQKSKYDKFISDLSQIDFSLKKISDQHYQIIYLTNNKEKVQYDFITYDNAEMAILLNGVETYRIPTKQSSVELTTNTKPLALLDTYYFWDNLYYVSGPYIPYSHVYREQYGISPYVRWSGTGTQLYHNQIEQSTSQFIAGGGGAAVGAFLGTLLGNAVGGAYGSVVGAVLGTVIGAALGAYVVVLDEYDCIWWMIGKTFVQWLYEYSGTIYALYMISSTLAESFIAGAFLSGGYLRVGTITLWDAIGAGNP